MLMMSYKTKASPMGMAKSEPAMSMMYKMRYYGKNGMRSSHKGKKKEKLVRRLDEATDVDSLYVYDLRLVCFDRTEVVHRI